MTDPNSTTPKQTILDLFHYNLSNFFNEEHREIHSEEIGNTISIVYEKELRVKEFDIFDFVQFRIFSDKSNITGSNHINVSFFSKTQSGTIEAARNITNKIAELYGKDDHGKKNWDLKDQDNFYQFKLNRFWTLGENATVYSITLNMKKKEGLKLNILFFSNLLKKIEDS